MKIGDLVRSKWMINSVTKKGMVGIIIATKQRSGTPVILWNGHDLGGRVLASPTPARWEYLEAVNENR
jgi:hypothetical protein